MKRRDLIALLEKNGWVFKSHGGSHDKYVKAGQVATIPRHKEINENLALVIMRRCGLKKGESNGKNISNNIHKNK